MTTIDTIAREIKYSRQDRDYACYVEGQYIGSRANYSDAETLCDQVAYDLLMDGQCATAAELDGDSDLDTIAADHAVVAPANCEPVADRVLAELVSRVYFCFVEGCDRPHRHIVGEAPLCCVHYAETTGRACDCPDTGPAPLPVDALLDEADAALSVCPGAFGPCGEPAHPSYAPYCARCARALDRVAAAAYIQRLAEDIGLSCSFCGEPHAAADCPLRRPLVVPGPRTCKNCGGTHSIQRCGEVLAALLAEPCAQAAAAQRKPNLIVSEGDGWRVEYDRASGAFVAMIDGVGCVGRHAKPHAAQALVRAHRP